MKTLNPFKTLVLLLVFAVALLSPIVDAQPAIELSPATPRAFQAFTANVTFAQDHCISGTYPLLGETSYSQGVLAIVLTHLKPGPCRKTHSVAIPGLPAGTQTLKISVSAQRATATSAPAILVETVQTQLSIQNIRGFNRSMNFWTARVESDGVFNPFGGASNSTDGPVVLWPFHGEPATGAGAWMEVGDNQEDAYTFKALSYTGKRSELPTSLVPLYSIFYPKPLRGVFYTTNAVLANKLSNEWNGRSDPLDADTQASSYTVVGQLTGGACPLGMTPVYQLFHPQAIAHRYTLSVSNYRLLMQNGYIGEGPAWCAN